LCLLSIFFACERAFCLVSSHFFVDLLLFNFIRIPSPRFVYFELRSVVCQLLLVWLFLSASCWLIAAPSSALLLGNWGHLSGSPRSRVHLLPPVHPSTGVVFSSSPFASKKFRPEIWNEWLISSSSIEGLALLSFCLAKVFWRW
jgi:hypothetical protein